MYKQTQQQPFFVTGMHKNKRPRMVLVSILGVLFLVILFLTSLYIQERKTLFSGQSQANAAMTLSENAVSGFSSFEGDNKHVVFFTLSSGDLKKPLYPVKTGNASDVISFLQGGPTFVEGASAQKLVPDEVKNLKLVETVSDHNQGYVNSFGAPLPSVHYYYEQLRCENIPVYGGALQVHTYDDDGVYAVSGSLLKENVDCNATISNEAAEKKALEAFKNEGSGFDIAGRPIVRQGVSGQQVGVVRYAEQRVYSPVLVGETGAALAENTQPSVGSSVGNTSDNISDGAGAQQNQDQQNSALNAASAGTSEQAKLARFIHVCSESGYCHGYMVDLKTGNILYDVQISTDAFKAKVTAGGSSRETSTPSGNSKIDQSYDIIEETYNYFFNSYQRDSFDGRGSTIIADIPNCGNNAYWTGTSMSICSSLVAKDVISHEFTHAVTQYTAGLAYRNESGAMNESMSDVFAMAIDSGNWTMGESTSLGVIRDLSDPGRKGHPDSMFSNQYYCGTGDNGGVHTNSGVFNKAFYLMVEGGSYNGCTITGMGKANMGKAHAVVYRALSTYMKGKVNGNYKDMADAMIQGCTDVHGAGSAECAIVTAALQATEMDQQVIGNSKSPKCTSVQKQTPACAGGPAQPTVAQGTPAPGGTTPTTSVTSAPVPTKTQGEPDFKAPLKSSVSIPASSTGDVGVKFENGSYRLTAKISKTALQEFLGVERLAALERSAGATNGIPVKGTLIGSEFLDTGNFVLENGSYTNTFTSSKDISGYHTYQVSSLTASGQEIPFLLADVSALGAGRGGSDTGTPAPTGTLPNPTGGTNTNCPSVANCPITTPGSTVPTVPSGGGPGNPARMVLNMTLRFQGIDKKPTSAQAILVRVGISGGSLESAKFTNALFTPGDGGKWTGKAVFEAIPEGATYRLLVKGPKHTQTRVCQNKPTEVTPGLYPCGEDEITLTRGENTLDFSGIVMLAGDLPPKQDGIVNSKDILSLRSRLNKSDFEALAIADVNYDGIVNALDDALVTFTLANRTDY